MTANRAAELFAEFSEDADERRHRRQHVESLKGRAMRYRHYENIASGHRLCGGHVARSGGRPYSLDARTEHVRTGVFPPDLCPECKAAQLKVMERAERNARRRKLRK